MYEALLIAGMFAVTFGVRYPVLAFTSRVRLPEIVLQGLKFVPGAVLSAIILPAIVMPDGHNADLSLSNSYLMAGIAAILISARTKNLMLTIILGMLIFISLRAITG